MRILGLDLSITSSGFCVMDVNDDFTVSKIAMYGFTKTQKWTCDLDGLTIFSLPSNYNSHPSHYRPTIVYNIIKDAIGIVDYVAIEDYAYGAKGKVFDLAEFAGGMKNNFYSNNIPIKKFSPMTIKLCATGSGAADKVMMDIAYKTSSLKNNVHPHLLELSDTAAPYGDLVDALYMANTLRLELSYSKIGKFPKDSGCSEVNMQYAIIKSKKNTSTKPSIEQPMITFGKYTSNIKKHK